jgi:hypothetical protein
MSFPAVPTDLYTSYIHDDAPKCNFAFDMNNTFALTGAEIVNIAAQL